MKRFADIANYLDDYRSAEMQYKNCRIFWRGMYGYPAEIHQIEYLITPSDRITIVISDALAGEVTRRTNGVKRSSYKLSAQVYATIYDRLKNIIRNNKP